MAGIPYPVPAFALRRDAEPLGRVDWMSRDENWMIFDVSLRSEAESFGIDVTVRAR